MPETYARLDTPKSTTVDTLDRITKHGEWLAAHTTTSFTIKEVTKEEYDAFMSRLVCQFADERKNGILLD